MNEEDYTKLLESATDEELAEWERLTAPKPIAFCPHEPTPKQREFLSLFYLSEVFYGGAAGGGKSDALIMDFLQYVDVPGYSGIIFRRTVPEMTMPGGLIQRCNEWFGWTEARWNGKTQTWTFPSGATLVLASMQHEKDKYDWKGAHFQFIGFDELTSFTESQYRYLFSRRRKLAGFDVPLRMRSASNPGDVGHKWVKDRFVAPKIKVPSRCFVPARLEDNPFLDYESYVLSLAELDPITRRQLLAGDWDAYEGGRFRKEWFRHTFRQTGKAYFLKTPAGEQEWAKFLCAHFTICDPAATAEEISDYTAIGAFAVTPDKQVLILDVVREQLMLEDIIPRVRDVALQNNSSYVGFEAVAFQWAMVHLARRLKGMPPVRPLSAAIKGGMPAQKGKSGKLVRATPAIVKAEAGEIFIPTYGAWIEAFVGELLLFTGDEKKDAFDDQVDIFAYACIQVNFAQVAQVQDDKPLQEEDEEDRRSPYPSPHLEPGRHGHHRARGIFGLR